MIVSSHLHCKRFGGCVAAKRSTTSLQVWRHKYPSDRHTPHHLLKDLREGLLPSKLAVAYCAPHFATLPERTT